MNYANNEFTYSTENLNQYYNEEEISKEVKKQSYRSLAKNTQEFMKDYKLDNKEEDAYSDQLKELVKFFGSVKEVNELKQRFIRDMNPWKINKLIKNLSMMNKKNDYYKSKGFLHKFIHLFPYLKMKKVRKELITFLSSNGFDKEKVKLIGSLSFNTAKMLLDHDKITKQKQAIFLNELNLLYDKLIEIPRNNKAELEENIEKCEKMLEEKKNNIITYFSKEFQFYNNQHKLVPSLVLTDLASYQNELEKWINETKDKTQQDRYKFFINDMKRNHELIQNYQNKINEINDSFEKGIPLTTNE